MIYNFSSFNNLLNNMIYLTSNQFGISSNSIANNPLDINSRIIDSSNSDMMIDNSTKDNIIGNSIKNNIITNNNYEII